VNNKETYTHDTNRNKQLYFDMKLQVIVKNLNKTATTGTSVETTVGPSDTALSLLERVSSVTNTLCFPNQKLRFNGKDLPDDLRLSSSDIKDGDVLELVFEASDDTLAKQLSDLLGDKALAVEELGLLYIHRHLVSVGDALKALGHATGKLHDFLAEQKHFSIEGSLVKTAKVSPKSSTSPCTTGQKGRFQVILQGPIEVRVDIEIHVPGNAPERLLCDEDDLDWLRLDASGSVAKAKEIITAFNQMPFRDCDLVLGETTLEDHLSLHDAGVSNGTHLVMIVRASTNSLVSQLETLLLERVGLSPNELSSHYCHRFGTSISMALRTLGLPSSLKQFLEAQPQFYITGGCVTLANGPKLLTPPPRQDKLHDKTQIQYFTEKGEKGKSDNSAGPPCYQ